MPQIDRERERKKPKKQWNIVKSLNFCILTHFNSTVYSFLWNLRAQMKEKRLTKQNKNKKRKREREKEREKCRRNWRSDKKFCFVHKSWFDAKKKKKKKCLGNYSNPFLVSFPFSELWLCFFLSAINLYCIPLNFEIAISNEKQNKNKEIRCYCGHLFPNNKF